MGTYNRYTKFSVDGKSVLVPFGKINAKDTDYFEIYKKGITRLDLLSYKYYNNSNYAWLIMQANPEFGSMEFEIPEGAVLRIPYPLKESISDYENSINEYNELY